jgi:hypothetical protein
MWKEILEHNAQKAMEGRDLKKEHWAINSYGTGEHVKL